MARGLNALRERGRPTLAAFRRYCRDLGVTEDVAEATVVTEKWVRLIAGHDARVALVQPDPSGRLRVVASGSEHPTTGRKRSTRRRIAFEERRTVRIDSGADGKSLALVPLIARDRTIGVLEIEASSREFDAGWEALDAIAEQFAIACDNVEQKSDLRRELDTIERAAGLARELGRARTPAIAVRIAVRFIADACQVPIAGWCADADGALRLIEVRGVGARRRRELRQALPTLTVRTSLDDVQRADEKARFAEVVGARRVLALDAGQAVVLAADPIQQAEVAFDVVGTLLSNVVRVLASAIDVEERTEQLHMGVTWTAHELRGPILGLRAALEVLLNHELREGDRQILARSLSELDHLATASEAVLRWSAEARQPERRLIDIVSLVDEAVQAVGLETGEDRILAFGPPEAVAHVDPAHMRTAIVNVLRNAVSYSDPGTKVVVTIEGDDDHVEIGVRNEGRGIPQIERQFIFGPFVRGTSSGAREGTGLGLFIASRLVRAHGGRIWAESEDDGVTFRMSLPGERRWEQRFVS